MKTLVIIGALLLISALVPTPVAGQDHVWITVKESTGVARSNECVTVGVPLPRSWNVTQPSQLRLTRGDDHLLPAQFEILSRWGGHARDVRAPAKWLLVSYPETVSAFGRQRVRLERTAEASPVLTGLSLASMAPDRLVVDTGAAVIEVKTNAFNLFDQVRVEGMPLLTALAPEAAIVYQDLNGTSVVARTTALKPRPGSVVVERTGPVVTILKIMGHLLDARQQVALDYTARCHFFAGRPEVRLDFTVENNYPIVTDESEQPRNVHDQGGTNSVYIGNLELVLQLASPAQPLGVNLEQNLQVIAPLSAVRVDQDSSGLPFWHAYVGRVGWESNVTCAPRLQSYCTLPGYVISGSGLSATGLQSLGYATVYREGARSPRLQAVVRDFWQNFPKAIEVRPEGRLAISLFPRGERFRHNLRVGEEKTHTLWFHFGLGAESEAVSADRARAFNAPLRGTVTPAWIQQTQVLGDVPVADTNQWPLYEHYARLAFEPNPLFDPERDDPSFGNATLMDAIERYNFFGWQDYGDVPLDYEAFGPNQAGQMNLKYWYLYGMLVQYCRSGDARWLDLALPAAWHLADIDYLHIPDDGIRHWVQGAYFGHSNHDEPGNTNPNRNSNSPSVDLFFGVPDLLLAYCLTGEPRFREVALEGLEAMLNESRFSDFTHPVLYRERGNLIFAYIEGYRQTGETRWWDALRTVVGETANLANKAWLTQPNTYRPAEDWHWQSSFQLSQIGWALGRFLDFCAEYNRPDDLGVRQALDAYADFVLRFFTQEYQTGRAAAWNAFYFYDPHEDPYLEIDSWALTTADMLAYAYKYTGQARYLEMASRYYATGTIDPVWPDDPPVYLATKDLVNTLNWGLVYMNLSSASVFPPQAPRIRILSHTTRQTVLQWDWLPAGARFVVEAADHVPPIQWTTVSGTAPLTTNVWTDPHASAAQRFWRIRAIF